MDSEMLAPVTTIDPGTTLGAIVTSHPGLAAELEQRGLDYCCGGNRTLADACAEAGLDAGATAAELGRAGAAHPPQDWSAMDAAQLVVHLVDTHHRYLWDEMARLSALTAKIASVHGGRHPELAEVAQCYEAIRADLEPHLLKEERILFPMVAELAGAADAPSFHCGSLRNPISVMLREHDQVGALLARLRQLTNGYRVPDDGCASYTACYAGLEHLELDTHLHIHKENNVLFPLVVRLEQELAGTAS